MLTLSLAIKFQKNGFLLLGSHCFFLTFSFSLTHWFKFGVPVVSSPPCFDVDSEVSMVEGMLTLLITLLSTRLHLGNTTAFYSYFFHISKSTNQLRFFMQSSLCSLQSEFQVMGSLACLVNTPVQIRSFAACSHVTSFILYMEFFRLKWRRLLQNVPSS